MMSGGDGERRAVLRHGLNISMGSCKEGTPEKSIRRLNGADGKRDDGAVSEACQVVGDEDLCGADAAGRCQRLPE